MGYQIGKSIGTILKTHYERLLFPFDVFKDGKTSNIVSYNILFKKDNCEKCAFQKMEENMCPTKDTDKDYKPHGIVSRMQIKPPPDKHARRSKRFENNDDNKTEVGVQ